MKKKIYITAVIAAVLSAFSSCAQTKPEVKPAFAESTEKSISRSEVQGTSRSEVQSAEQITEQSAELAAQTSEPELIPLTMTEAETTTLDDGGTDDRGTDDRRADDGEKRYERHGDLRVNAGGDFACEADECADHGKRIFASDGGACPQSAVQL